MGLRETELRGKRGKKGIFPGGLLKIKLACHTSRGKNGTWTASFYTVGSAQYATPKKVPVTAGVNIVDQRQPWIE
jgi:hypothetical protein